MNYYHWKCPTCGTIVRSQDWCPICGDLRNMDYE